MKTNKIHLELGILIVFAVLLSSYVHAFGIGSAYHKDNPLELSPGETREINFNLQNMAGSENISVRGGISKGSEVLSLIDTGDILVQVGGSVDVRAKVSIPSSAKIGDTYAVRITFTTVAKSEAGAFGFGSSVGREFNVIVVPTPEERAKLAELAEEKPASKTNLGIIILSIILIIAIIIAYILRKKRKR